MKPRLIIHNPTNFNTKNYRYYNIFFDNLVDKLKTKFDIIENRYFIDAHKMPYNIKLLCDQSDNKYTTKILECEMILEHYDSKQIKILSVSDYFSDANLGLFNNTIYSKYITKILISQFNKQKIIDHTHTNIDPIYSPWIYFPSNLYNLDYFYTQRQQLPNLKDRMYFRGSGFEHRPLIGMLRDVLDGGLPIGNFETYANEAIHYKIGFSCAGSAQLCYRDIEYMALGLPMLRFKYTNEMNPNLIPNYHYIAIDTALELHEEHKATQDHAKLITEKFFEVKDNTDFLNYISNNARKYYLDYIHDSNGVEHTLQLLNICEWI